MVCGDLSDAEWELIGPLLLPERRRWSHPAGIIGASPKACSMRYRSAAFVADLDPDGIEEHKRAGLIQRPGM